MADIYSFSVSLALYDYQPFAVVPSKRPIHGSRAGSFPCVAEGYDHGWQNPPQRYMAAVKVGLRSEMENGNYPSWFH